MSETSKLKLTSPTC